MAKKKRTAARSSGPSSAPSSPAPVRGKARANYSKAESRWFIIGVIAAVLIAAGLYLVYPELWSPPAK